MKSLMLVLSLAMSANAFAATQIECRINGGIGSVGDDVHEGLVEFSKDGRTPEETTADFVHLLGSSPKPYETWTIDFFARKRYSASAFQAYRAKVAYAAKERSLSADIGDPTSGAGASAGSTTNQPIAVQWYGVPGLIAGENAYLEMTCSASEAAPSSECLEPKAVKETLERYRSQIKAVPGVTTMFTLPANRPNPHQEKCAFIQVNVKDQTARAALEKKFGNEIDGAKIYYVVSGVVQPH
jgi:hypothetical protein